MARFTQPLNLQGLRVVLMVALYFACVAAVLAGLWAHDKAIPNSVLNSYPGFVFVWVLLTSRFGLQPQFFLVFDGIRSVVEFALVWVFLAPSTFYFKTLEWIRLRPFSSGLQKAQPAFASKAVRVSWLPVKVDRRLTDSASFASFHSQYCNVHVERLLPS